MTNDELSALILAWAKAEHPDKYAETLKQAVLPKTYRRYLLRLIEIRCEADGAWMLALPVSVLDETKLVRRFKLPTGGLIVVGGRYTKDSIDTRWIELGATQQDWAMLRAAKEALDLEYIPEAV